MIPLASGFLLPSAARHQTAPTAGGVSPPFFIDVVVLLKKTPANNVNVATLFAGTNGDSLAQQQETKSKVAPAVLGLVTWFTTLSYFIVQNYKFGPWPTKLPTLLPKRGWVLIHALASMLFSGGIILSTILEWSIISGRASANPQVVRFWFSDGTVSLVQKAIVLPALTLTIISGMAQAAMDYGCMSASPLHIRVAIHILATFCLWWGGTDLTTLHVSKAAVLEWYPHNKDTQQEAVDPLPNVLFLRRWSNVVSCLFLGLLYAFMALKPGYTT